MLNVCAQLAVSLPKPFHDAHDNKLGGGIEDSVQQQYKLLLAVETVRTTRPSTQTWQLMCPNC